MTLLHGTMAGAEIDALRLSLKKKLISFSELPSHIVAFRTGLARLVTDGQPPLPLDAYRTLFCPPSLPFPFSTSILYARLDSLPYRSMRIGLFLSTLTPFPIFHQYTLLFTVANGAIVQQADI